jgi:hypothetical protein
MPSAVTVPVTSAKAGPGMPAPRSALVIPQDGAACRAMPVASEAVAPSITGAPGNQPGPDGPPGVRGIGRCLAGDLDDVAHALAGGAVDDRDLLGRDGRADEQDRVDAAHGRVQRVRPVEIACDVDCRREAPGTGRGPAPGWAGATRRVAGQLLSRCCRSRRLPGSWCLPAAVRLPRQRREYLRHAALESAVRWLQR